MEHPRSPRGYTYIMTYRKVIRQLVAENVSNPLAKARRVWYNADTMLDTIFLRNQRNERKNRVKMDCLAPYGANNAERQKSGNDRTDQECLVLTKGCMSGALPLTFFRRKLP
jgi:hypothetical protein